MFPIHRHNILPRLAAAMEQLKSAASQTKVVVKLPTKWISMYSDFITKNAGAVGQVEGALRSLTYLVPGGLRRLRALSSVI